MLDMLDMLDLLEQDPDISTLIYDTSTPVKDII